jgi:hypothetical protein
LESKGQGEGYLQRARSSALSRLLKVQGPNKLTARKLAFFGESSRSAACFVPRS